MEKVEYLKIEEVENSGLFRYRNLLDDSAFSIGDEPVRFFRDMILSSLGGTESSYSIVKTEVRRMVIDEVEQHFKTEEAIMPLDGDAVLFAGEAGEAPPSSWTAFLVPALTMVVFENGVWHKAPFPLSGAVNSLVVLPPLTYLNDCKVVALERKIEIVRGAL